MSNKRYAIVRVDGTCPIHTERLSSQEIDGMFNCSYDNCEDCRYGDTKEQLIAKVKQAIQIGYNKGIILSDTMAKFIVEFLGVEDDKKKERR